MKFIEKIEKIEKFWLKNITWISITLIILVLLLDLIPLVFWLNINLLSTTNTLTFIWAIFVFWYWYKKYERDKEIEFLWHNISNPPKIDEASVLIFNWSRLYDLYQKEYIKKDIWLDLENQYMQNYQEILSNSDSELTILTDLIKLLIPIWNRKYFISLIEKIDLFYEWQINIYSMTKEEYIDQNRLKKFKLIRKKINDLNSITNTM